MRSIVFVSSVLLFLVGCFCASGFDLPRSFRVVYNKKRAQKKVHNLGPGRPRWWEKVAKDQGQNICVSERVVGTPRRFGRPWTGGQMCGMPSVVFFDCCEGYGVMPGEPGCALVKPLTNILEGIPLSGAQTLSDVIRSTPLTEILAKDGPFTLFAPLNDAFRQSNRSNETNRLGLSELPQLHNNSAINKERAAPALLYYHVVEGRIGETDFEDNMLIPSLYNQLPLRINKFKNGLLTVNCIPLVKLNQEATNGIIHTIEDLLIPPVQNTIADIILGDDQFSRMATAVVKAKFTSLLREQRTFTVFVPTNQAFDELVREDFEAIFADPDALQAMLEYHVLTETWCSCSVYNESTLRTLEGTQVKMTCNGSTIFVNDAAIVKGDVMATNGFIHVINKVILPKRAKSLLEIAVDLRLLHLVDLVPSSGLINMFVNGGKFTVFAPSREAMLALPNRTLNSLSTNPAAVYGLLVGHMVTGKYRTSNFADKQSLPTLAHMRPLQVNIYPQKILIDGNVIVNPNNEGRNGVIHVIDKVLFPPTLTIGEYLRAHINMSILSNAMNHTLTKLLDDLLIGEGPYTVFAPDDVAFDQLPYFTLDRMLLDPEILTSVMTNHIIDDQIFTKGLLPKAYYEYRTRNGRSFKIREDTGLVTAGTAIIKQADILCLNGVLHIVDRVIQIS